MIKKFLIFLAGLVIALGAIYVILAITAQPAPDQPFFDHGQEMLVIAHRGGRRLWPENTLYAFQKAHQLGVDVLEMDVHSTRDGALVLMHDSTVDRTTDGSGPVQEHILTEIQDLDAGYNWTADEGATYPYRGQGITVPTLEEIFTALPEARMNIEIKQAQPAIIQPLCDIIREYGMSERVLVASFDQDTIHAFRQVCPEVATTAGEDEVTLLYGLSFVYLGHLYTPSSHAVQVPEHRGGIHVLLPRFVKAAQDRNMDVHAWTINEEQDMERMLELGLDGIITDYPDRLLVLLGR